MVRARSAADSRYGSRGKRGSAARGAWLQSCKRWCVTTTRPCGFSTFLRSKSTPVPIQKHAHSARVGLTPIADHAGMADERILRRCARHPMPRSGTHMEWCTAIVRLWTHGLMQTLSRFYFDWAVNHAAMSPDRKLFCIVGDDTTGLLADASSGKGAASSPTRTSAARLLHAHACIHMQRVRGTHAHRHP